MDEMNKSKIGIIILAAGASTRLGRPKQLLKFKNKTLIEKVCETALETGFQSVVVLGANSEKIKPAIENLPINFCENSEWQTGMSSSIQAGLQNLLETNPELSAAIILLCDQPFITKKTIFRLVAKQKETGKAIVTSKYGETIGVPALFRREIFEELFALRGDIGARFLIQKFKAKNLAKIPAPEAEFDIDTEEDLIHL